MWKLALARLLAMPQPGSLLLINDVVQAANCTLPSLGAWVQVALRGVGTVNQVCICFQLTLMPVQLLTEAVAMNSWQKLEILPVLQWPQTEDAPRLGRVLAGSHFGGLADLTVDDRRMVEAGAACALLVALEQLPALAHFRCRRSRVGSRLCSAR